MAEERERKTQVKEVKFCVNDHRDVLVEILKRMDGRSLGVAACVCRLWHSFICHDWLWENVCFRYVSPPPYDVRSVVVALGGFRRLYIVCLRPLLSRIGGGGGRDSAVDKVRNNRVWTRDEVQLSLSLFSIDYYERLVLRSAVEDETSPSPSSSSSSSSSSSMSSSSLMFLCKAVNV